MADLPGRRPARASRTIGGPEGLHLPGIFPEPDVIEAQDGPSAREEALLADLREALPAEDREPEAGAAEGLDAPGAEAAVELPRQRAQLPWWYATLFLAGGALGLLGAATQMPGGPVLGLVFLAAGAAMAWGAAASLRNRLRKRDG